jgi:hypothetical protein
MNDYRSAELGLFEGFRYRGSDCSVRKADADRARLAELERELILTWTGDGGEPSRGAICRIAPVPIESWIFRRSGEPNLRLYYIGSTYLPRPRKIPKKNSRKNPTVVGRNPAIKPGIERGPGNRLGSSQSRACRAAHATEKRGEGIMAG